MFIFYAIKPAFYSTLSTHIHILEDIMRISSQQRSCMLYNIQKKDITKSAISFFGCAIYEEGDELLFDLQFSQGRCKMNAGGVEMDDMQNPFYVLLCRLYPFHIIQDIE